MKNLKDFIRNFLPTISDESLQLVLKNSKIRKFKKGEVIASKGEKPEFFYVILSGIARGFFIDKNGKELIKTLYLPPSTCGPLTALIKQGVSESTYDCITDCEFVELDYINFKKQVKTNHELSLLNLAALESIFVRTNERVNDLTILNATERYLKLKSKIPNIDNLIQQYHIASYLNITPVQLSRIRKKIYSK